MPIEILMPALSPTMTEGNLVKWLKNEGDMVEPGEIIAEIETDKATMEVESVDEGKLGKILVAEGTESVPVNKLIALLLEEGEDASSLEGYEASDPVSCASDVALEEETNVESVPQSSENLGSSSSSNEKIYASPLAKRIAGNENLDLSLIEGTGPHGRIIKADVLEFAENKPSVSNNAPSFSRGGSRMVPNSNMRKVIAKRLLESKQNVPHFYLNVECNIDSLISERLRMNKFAAELSEPYKISVNDFVIKACAMALQHVPEANASWTDENIIYYNDVDISVAVAIEGGLITPIIKDANYKSLSVISNEMKDLAKRAKENSLKPEEFQGGSFSISNLGMFGVKKFNAIINPPQSCIIAVGAADDKLVMNEDGSVKNTKVMEVSLSCDHRVVDGAVGAAFLSKFKKFIENPSLMVL